MSTNLSQCTLERRKSLLKFSYISAQAFERQRAVEETRLTSAEGLVSKTRISVKSDKKANRLRRTLAGWL
jgi:hypothetical protein